MNDDYKPADGRGPSVDPRQQANNQNAANKIPVNIGTQPVAAPAARPLANSAQNQATARTQASTPVQRPVQATQARPAQPQLATRPAATAMTARPQSPAQQQTQARSQQPAADYDESIAMSEVTQGPWYRRIASKLSRKQWIIFVSGVILVVGGGVSYALTHSDGSQNSYIPAKQAAAPPKPAEPPYSPLTGVVVAPEDVGRVVTGVMIENSTFARPQSGLSQAGVVFEAIAEYGITRFLALYQEDKPGDMGPVRSARPYYVDWARSFDAPLAHVGGSPDALKKIKAEGVKDLDQMFNSNYYRRISSREAPHNVYTTTNWLNKAELSKGWGGSSFTGFARKKPSEVKVPTTPPTAKSINIAISGPTYNVHYDYDVASNSYKRVMAGTPHKDAANGAQIAPNVVIGLVTAYSLESDGYHSRYQVSGSNTAYVFQEGTVTQVTWKREAGNTQYVFTDAAGKVFKLDPGRTWVTVVGKPTDVTYTP